MVFGEDSQIDEIEMEPELPTRRYRSGGAVSSGDVPQGAVTGVVITVTAMWAISIAVQLAGWREIDPGINGIMGAVIAFLGITFGKSRWSRNTIQAQEDAGETDDDR